MTQRVSAMMFYLIFFFSYKYNAWAFLKKKKHGKIIQDEYSETGDIGLQEFVVGTSILMFL